MRLDPSLADARAGVGLAPLARGELGRAESNLRLALGLRYHAPALHQQLGALYASQGRWAEADGALRTALSRHPGLAGAAEMLRRVEDVVAGVVVAGATGPG